MKVKKCGIVLMRAQFIGLNLILLSKQLIYEITVVCVL